MIINKITTGFVTQQYDTEQGRFISQEFVAGDEVEYECGGESVNHCVELKVITINDYLSFDMVQPLAVASLKEQLQENILAVLDGAFDALDDGVRYGAAKLRRQEAVLGQVCQVIVETVNAAQKGQ